jgi:hypothetical protein
MTIHLRLLGGRLASVGPVECLRDTMGDERNSEGPTWPRSVRRRAASSEPKPSRMNARAVKSLIERIRRNGFYRLNAQDAMNPPKR